MPVPSLHLTLVATYPQAVLAKIKTISHSHIVRPGIEAFKNREPGDYTALPKEQIPGLRESYDLGLQPS